MVALLSRTVFGKENHSHLLIARSFPEKIWEPVYVWKLSVKSIRIRPIYFRIIACAAISAINDERYSRLPVELPSTP